MGIQNTTATSEDSWSILTKLNLLLWYDSNTMFFVTYPKLLKAYVHMKICTQMFTASLFTVAKTWKQQRCPSISELINKLWCIQSVVYYSVLKVRESFPRQVDKNSRVPQGERGLGFSRRKKGQTFFFFFFHLHSLGLFNNNVSCLRTVSGLNLWLILLS